MPQIEEEMESEREQDNTDANESDEEEDDRDDDPLAEREEGAHSSGYNLRKRKEVNYRETRKYNTTATVLYQYGEASKTKESLMTKVDQGKAMEPRDMFKRCVGICMNQMSAKAGIRKHARKRWRPF